MGRYEGKRTMPRRKTKPTYSHIERVMKLREMLDQKPFVTIAGLREEFGVSRRTVYNDLEALQTCGVPLYNDMADDNSARWMIEHSARRRTVTLTGDQLRTLYLARRLIAPMDAEVFNHDLDSVFDRLSKGLTPADKEFIERLPQKLHFVSRRFKDYKKKRTPLEHLLFCLKKDKLAEVHYRNVEGRRSKHLVEPYAMVVYRTSLYLLGYSHSRKDMRTFMLDRISRVDSLKEGFKYPEDFDPDAYFANAFGITVDTPQQVVVIFDASEAQFVEEHIWHPQQKLEHLPDGRIKLTMKVSGIEAVLRWLMGFGANAEIVSPQGLREEAARRLRGGAKRYRGTSPSLELAKATRRRRSSNTGA
jgi:predicted DNA-binding transcriptional regulator YafY